MKIGNHESIKNSRNLSDIYNKKLVDTYLKMSNVETAINSKTTRNERGINQIIQNFQLYDKTVRLTHKVSKFRPL